MIHQHMGAAPPNSACRVILSLIENLFWLPPVINYSHTLKIGDNNTCAGTHTHVGKAVGMAHMRTSSPYAYGPPIATDIGQLPHLYMGIIPSYGYGMEHIQY